MTEFSDIVAKLQTLKPDHDSLNENLERIDKRNLLQNFFGWLLWKLTIALYDKADEMCQKYFLAVAPAEVANLAKQTRTT